MPLVPHLSTLWLKVLVHAGVGGAAESQPSQGCAWPPGSSGVTLGLYRARGVPVMTGPKDPAAAGRDRLRAGHADREQVIGALKAAFVQGMLAKDEFDGRVGQALASRTYADLAALTSDILPAPAAARLAHPPAPKRRRPLVRAAAQSGACLVIAAAALGGASILDPGPNVPGHGGGGV